MEFLVVRFAHLISEHKQALCATLFKSKDILSVL